MTPDTECAPGAPLLRATGLGKRFPGVIALEDVSLTLQRGEVVAVIGENGAGKSTLMKILAGVQAPDSGSLLLDGEAVAFNTTREATEAGISLIHQELNLASNLSVGANLYLGREPRRGPFIDRQAIQTRSQAFLDRVGLDVRPQDSLEALSIGKQQLVEIAKALSANARVLIFDEPTSSLSTRETERLYEVIDQLRAEGVGVLYISHRLGEVKRLADRVVVLRDGRNAGELHRQTIHHDAMVRLMVGRDLSQFYDRKTHPLGEEVLAVSDIQTAAFPRQRVSFTARRGEIVGLAGLVGAGRTELLEALFGIHPPLSGEIRIDGDPFQPESPRTAMARGMALVPEDRKADGVFLDMSVGVNISLTRLERDQRHGFIERSAEARLIDSTIEQLRVRTPNPRQVARFLSGGNQQKLVIGKWLALNPKILLMDEPTRGIDIGAKQEIYHLMETLASQGALVLFASSEMEEILGMSDRVLVLSEGRLAGTLSRDQLSEEAVMKLATQTEPSTTATLS